VRLVARPVKPSSPPARRAYESPLRRAKAQETERRVLAAAAALFDERGYVGTSLAAVAERAGINPRTVYKVFDSKVSLLSRLVDVAIVGDQEAVSVADRPWAAAAFDAATGRARVRAYAGAVRRVMASAGAAFRVAAQAAAADPEAAALWAVGQRLRLEDSTAFVESLHDAGLLRSDRRRPDAVATVWLVTSPETFTQLGDGLGWTLERYGRWLEQVLAAALLDDDERQGR
jgi:AcrR family transcriptional regulator